MGQFVLIFCSCCGILMRSDEEEKKPDDKKPRPVMRIYGSGREIVFHHLCYNCRKEILDLWMDCAIGEKVQ